MSEIKQAPMPTHDIFVQGVREIEPTLNAEGQLEQAWEVYTLDAETLAVNQAALAQRRLDEAKAARQSEVDALKVTTSTGKVFDGDEVSQGRMSRAILAADITGLTECVWILADSVPATITLAELKEALALSIQAQGAIWARPYQ